MISNLLGERVLLELRATRAAADAAREVSGVVRLQPGLWGMVRHFSADLWRHATGEELGDTAGVEVELDDPRAVVRISLVTDARDQALAVVRSVQSAVHAAVLPVLPRDDIVVSVYVADIDLSGLAA
jgi:uncharacterized alkaline shock family protein YloU